MNESSRDPNQIRDKDNLHTFLVSAIKTRIEQWNYPPEYRLLEQEVCERYGVSRSPAREALRTLEADGYLKKMPRKGYIIRQPSPNQAREMYEVRLALELFVIEHLAKLGIDDAQFEELSSPWNNASGCIDKSDEQFAELDRSFHETFARLLGNTMLSENLRAIDERLHVFRIIEFANPETRKSTCEQHTRILNAVKERDNVAARLAVRKNIESAIVHVEEAIKEALARSYMRDGKEE